MMVNYVVSAYGDIWMPGAKRLFATHPYILHVLKREGRLADYEETQVANIKSGLQQEFECDHAFVDLKYRKYMPILIGRLDELHNTSHGEPFWQKALSLSILRHVALCYEFFQVCEASFDVAKHNCQVIDTDDYFVPEDFDAHRHFFQNSDMGREQFFSIYCGLFYPGYFTSYKINNKTKLDTDSLAFLAKISPKTIILYLKRVYRSLCNLRVAKYTQMGIMDCSFSSENIDRLISNGKGKIQVISLPSRQAKISRTNWLWRDTLVNRCEDFDRFDDFVFACLRHGMPKMYIEDFHSTFSFFNKYFGKYSDLRWVVCEWWIGHAYSSFATAMLSLRKIKHISPEHNYLSHFFLGTNLKYLAPLADEYMTLGWVDESNRDVIKGASLYRWVEQNTNPKKDHQILFISSIPLAYAPEINSAYGEFGAYKALAYLEWNKLFLKSLDEKTLSEMYFRSYPMKSLGECLVFDQLFEWSPYVDKVKIYDNFGLVSSRLLMQQSRLVIVNYLSTSYLEALIANIPTVFFWNKNSYFINEKYSHIFDELIEVGICQTNPEDAAAFIEIIKDKPEDWWSSVDVQNCRKKFLRENFGEPEFMIQYLLAKV